MGSSTSKWRNHSPSGSSGIKHMWKLWRHCCCRFGFYPLAVAPIVTAACLLDIYSSFDCEFMHVHVGFIPSNDSWNGTSVATLGLFQYQSGLWEEANDFRNALFQGCRSYTDEFAEEFMDFDRNWEVTQIMALISGVSGMVATVTAWLLVVTPLPACFFWPGVLLPSLLVAFLCEGAKFLFLDAGVCQAAMWYPSGSESLPRIAKSCEITKTSYFSIASGICFFLSLLLVCLKAPERRKLEEDYGFSGQSDTDDDDLHAVDVNLSRINAEDSFVYPNVNIMEKRGELMSDYASSLGNSETQDGNSIDNPEFYAMIHKDGSSASSYDVIRGGSSTSNRASASSLISLPSISAGASASSMISGPSISADSDDARYPSKAKSSAVGTMVNNLPPRPKKTIITSARVISQARLAKAESMQLQTRNSSDDLIEKCVLEVTQSFCEESPSMTMQTTQDEPTEEEVTVVDDEPAEEEEVPAVDDEPTAKEEVLVVDDEPAAVEKQPVVDKPAEEEQVPVVVDGPSAAEVPVVDEPSAVEVGLPDEALTVEEPTEGGDEPAGRDQSTEGDEPAAAVEKQPVIDEPAAAAEQVPAVDVKPAEEIQVPVVVDEPVAAEKVPGVDDEPSVEVGLSDEALTEEEPAAAGDEPTEGNEPADEQDAPTSYYQMYTHK